jgi:hypothetical protein
VAQELQRMTEPVNRIFFSSEGQAMWQLGLGKKRDQQRKNEISSPIQPQHLLIESVRLKQVVGTR